MNGKTCLVTGATSGIGKATAVGLARLGASVVIVGRNEDKCRSTSAWLMNKTGSQAVDHLVAEGDEHAGPKMQVLHEKPPHQVVLVAETARHRLVGVEQQPGDLDTAGGQDVYFGGHAEARSAQAGRPTLP